MLNPLCAADTGLEADREEVCLQAGGMERITRKGPENVPTLVFGVEETSSVCRISLGGCSVSQCDLGLKTGGL